MKKKMLTYRLFAPLLAAFVFLAGCSGTPEIGRRDAKELYDMATASYRAEKYEEAEKALKALMDDHPLSPYSVEGHLMLGDVYFAMERYDDAGSYYTNFYSIHPSHQRAAYAVFQKGMSHLKDVLTIDRDQTATKKALYAFEDLVTAYPASPYEARSRELIAFLRHRLAEREFYVGKFYYKGKNYKGALARFKELLKRYPDAGLTDETLFYIGEAYASLGEKRLANDAYSTIITNFPESPFAASAKTRLKGS